MLSRRDVCGAFLVIRKLAGIGGYSLTLCGGFLECCVAWSDVGGPPGGCHVTLCLSCTGGFDPNVEHRVRGAAELVFAWRLKHRAWFVVCVGLCPAFSRRFSGNVSLSICVGAFFGLWHLAWECAGWWRRVSVRADCFGQAAVARCASVWCSEGVAPVQTVPRLRVPSGL